MDTKVILNKVQSGELSPAEALRLLKAQPFDWAMPRSTTIARCVRARAR